MNIGSVKCATYKMGGERHGKESEIQREQTEQTEEANGTDCDRREAR